MEIAEPREFGLLVFNVQIPCVISQFLFYLDEAGILSRLRLCIIKTNRYDCLP